MKYAINKYAGEMRPIVMSVMLMLASVSAYGQVVFDECFSDSTLRLDYAVSYTHLDVYKRQASGR